MSEAKYTVRFLDVPKEPEGLREALHAKNLLTHNSRKMSLEDADKAVKQAAQKLGPDQRIDLTLEIKEKRKNDDNYNFKMRPILSNRLADDGLYSLLSPLLNTDDSKRLRDLLNDISAQLMAAEQKHYEESDDDDDPAYWHDQSQDDSDDYYENSEEQSDSYEDEDQNYSDDVNYENEEELDNENDTSAVNGLVPEEAQENENHQYINDAESEPETSSSTEQGTVDDSELSRMLISDPKNTDANTSHSDDSMPKMKRNQHEQVQDYRPILIPSAQFINAEDIYTQIPKKYDSTTFDLNTILKNLGYVDSPKDDYERSLNLALQEKAAELKLDKFQTGYVKKVAALKQKLVQNLGDYYHRINDRTVALAVNDKCREKLNQLEQEATEKKNKYVQNGQIEKKKNLDQINDRIEQQVADYRAKLIEGRQAELRQTNEKIDKQVSKYKESVDRELEENSKKIRVDEQDKEINVRNNQLSHERFTQSQDFLSDMDKLFNKFDQGYNDKLQVLKSFAKHENDRIQKQKNTDSRIADSTKAREADRLERKRANDLKEKELKNQQDLPKDMAAAIAAALSQTQQGQAPNYGTHNMQMPYGYPPYYMPPAQPVPQAQAPQAPAQDTVTSKQIHDMQEEIKRLRAENEENKRKAAEDKMQAENNSLKQALDEERAKNRASKRKTLVAKASGLAAIMILGAGGFSFYQYQNGHTQNASQSQAVLNKASLRNYNSSTRQPKHNSESTSKKANNSDKASSEDDTSHTATNQSSKPNTAQAAVETDNNLKNYQEAKTWQQKVDSLNAMLGQHDIRALKEINDSQPTKLSHLYEAICMKNDADMRNTYLSMNSNERKDMSWSARNDVALAFYNIKDWHNGWYVRYGY